MNIEEKLRELLIPVFGLNTIDEIQPEHSLVLDLGAESLDFVEIAYIVESHFGVALKTNEIMIGGANISPNSLFVDGRLNADGAATLNLNLEQPKFHEGQTRRDLFESITVSDLANLIKLRSEKTV